MYGTAPNKDRSPLMQISVAMCTYNGGRYLQDQLESIATQSLLPDELVICDDGSTDATAEIIRAFAAKVSFPVHFERNEKNLGSTKNFEKAIGLCRGELIALCDQDDVWLPEKLAILGKILRNDPNVGGVFCNAYLIDDASHRMGPLLWDEVKYSPNAASGTLEDATLLRHNVVTGCMLIFRASLRSAVTPIPPSWVHDGWLAWMMVLYFRLVYVSEPLAEYRVHASQQVGLAKNTSIWDRVTRARQTGNEPQLVLARQFEALREFWIEHPTELYQERADGFTGKIRHSYLRGQLPKNRFERALRIAANYGDYRHYSLGLLTMAKDLMR
jgi:glycosyltransferase involved in cell wall biosynthesis